MADVTPRQGRLVRFVEAAPYPSLLLLIPIVVLYGRGIDWGFMLDDFRHLRIMEEFQAGEREHLHLYRFLISDEANAAARRDGSQPWWLGDDVRYQHWRPLAEWSFYAQFRVFGRSPIGYRIITLAAYWLGAWLTYRLFRKFPAGERAARWGALAFTTLACHSIPNVFISAQADVVVLVTCAALLLAALRLATTGRLIWLIPIAALFAGSLGFKEAFLPVAILPALIGWIAFNGAVRRRLIGVSCLLCTIGLAWLVAYSRGGFGSNTMLMLSPLDRPWEYLRALPLRGTMLLSSLAIPVNPFVFFFRPRGEPLAYVYCVVGVVTIVGIARAIYQRGAGDRMVPAMTAFVLVFLPLLVCTVPDDRILMLPSIGFAYLIGVWIAGSQTDSPRLVRRCPMVLFLGVHSLFVICTTQAMHLVETRIQENYRDAMQLCGDVEAGDVVFLLDSTFDPQVIFAKEAFIDATGRADVGVRYLSDSESLEIHRTGPNTLELTDANDGLFNSFLGDMARSRVHPKRVGDRLDAGELTGRILRADGERTRTVELTFRRNLDDRAYHFFRCGEYGRPVPWPVPPIERR